LMVSVLVCEIFLAIFYLFDDFLSIPKFIYRKFRSQTIETPPRPRRQFIKKTAALLGMLPFVAFIDGITKGKYRFTVHHQTVAFPDLPDAFNGFTIAQISDVHAGSFDSPTAIQNGLQLLQEQNADIICFTGDLVNTFSSEIEPYLKDFAALSAPYGKFSILGNHDYPVYRRMFKDEAEGEQNHQEIIRHHKTMGFNLLRNQAVSITKDNTEIRLLGVENWGRSHHFPKEGDLEQTVKNCPKNSFNVLLSHDPTHWADKVIDFPKQIHLTLSGHTHGMQMGIDLPFFKWSPVKYVYRHWAGLYKEKNQYLYVNRGFGFLGFAGRVGIYPEITLLKLKKA
jgi:predicted MPP superfamily phosphohydrolase